MENRRKYLSFIIVLLLCSCANKNENVLHESFNIIFEESRLYYMNIAKTYECSNKNNGYTILAGDVWNVYEIHKKVFNANQEIDKAELIKLQDEIHKLAKKYSVSIKAQPLKDINDYSDNLLVANAENTLLKELEKKIHCDNAF